MSDSPNGVGNLRTGYRFQDVGSNEAGKYVHHGPVCTTVRLEPRRETIAAVVVILDLLPLETQSELVLD